MALGGPYLAELEGLEDQGERPRAADGDPDRLGSRPLDGIARRGALQSDDGVRQADVSGRFRAAHAVIGVKGATPGDVIERSGSEPVRVAVGRARPLALVLEAFDLR